MFLFPKINLSVGFQLLAYMLVYSCGISTFDLTFLYLFFSSTNAYMLVYRQIDFSCFSVVFSSTNAYMLVYRQIDKQRNEEVMAQADFPEHLQQELYRLQNREEEEKKQKELDRSTCKVSHM